jgi:hypothetical protein
MSPQSITNSAALFQLKALSQNIGRFTSDTEFSDELTKTIIITAFSQQL